MGLNISYNAGGTIDEIKKIGRIVGFPEFSQPYNVMVSQKIPAMDGVFQLSYETLDEEVEILSLTVTCTGYHEDDRYDLLNNEKIWFKDWATSEVKEGLYLGTSTYVYRTPPKSMIKLLFKNYSKTSKTIYLGIRMLIKGEQ